MAAAPPTLRLQTTPVASQYGGFRLSPPSPPPSLHSPPLVIRARSSVPIPLLRTRLLNLNLNQSLSASPPRRRRSRTSATSSDFIHPVGKVMGPNLLLVNSCKRGDSSDGQWYFFSRTGKNFPSDPSGEVLVIGLLNKKETKGTVLFQDPKFQEWDSISSMIAGAANVPFLLLQLPQIVLNARNLLAGNTAALFAVPWLGMLTGLLGNLSLLSYFAKKKETEAVFVQTLGVVSTYAVIAQLSIAKAMPLPQFVATTIVVAVGLVLNFLNYFGRLPKAIWNHWEDFITIGGLAVLPQVMWSTFVPFVPSSILPGLISLTLAVTTVAMARSGRLSEKGTRLVGSVSGWTATLLFMWMPVAQMWTNYLNPDNIKGLSAFTMLLAMMGNGLMIPRALFIRDLMWFTGSAWATFLQGWGNLFCMYCFNTISRVFFFGTSIGLLVWIGMVLWRDTVAYGHRSPLTSLKELFFGS